MVEVSVVVPYYNRLKYLKKSINSIINQTLPVSEIIIVNDNSWEDPTSILRDMDDSRIKLINLSVNSGAQFARNTGIKNAKYEWIAFNDSDDEWSPEKIEKQIKKLAETNFDKSTVIFTNYYTLTEENTELTLVNLPSIDNGEHYKALLRSPGPMFQSLLVSKSALNQIGYLDENIPSYQEWDTSIALAKYCSFIHIHEPLYTYNIYNSGNISENKLRDIEGYQFIINKYKQEIIWNCGMESYNNHILFLIKRSLKYGFWELANSYMKQLNNYNSPELEFFKFCLSKKLAPDNSTYGLFYSCLKKKANPSLIQSILNKIK